MKRRVLLRPAAAQDLDSQAEYLAQHAGVETGVRFYRAAEETFRMLASRPEMGRVVEFPHPTLSGLRAFPLREFPRHLVFYKFIGNDLDVVRVLHGARDIESLFEG